MRLFVYVNTLTQWEKNELNSDVPHSKQSIDMGIYLHTKKNERTTKEICIDCYHLGLSHEVKAMHTQWFGVMNGRKWIKKKGFFSVFRLFGFLLNKKSQKLLKRQSLIAQRFFVAEKCFDFVGIFGFANDVREINSKMKYNMDDISYKWMFMLCLNERWILCFEMCIIIYFPWCMWDGCEMKMNSKIKYK